MTEEPVVERIDRELEELMDRFFVQSRKDLQQMYKALENSDLTTLARLGHTAKGAGNGYGLHRMGDIGLQIETAAKERNMEQSRAAVETMARYLDMVSVEYK